MIQIQPWKDSVHGSQELRWSFFKSSIGYLLVAWVDEGICSLSIHKLKNHKNEALADLKKRFPEMIFQQQRDCPYRTDIEGTIQEQNIKNRLPVVLRGTPFQMKVWRALSQIPKSTTASYKELAEKVKSPRGFRAVGSAVGANPIGVLIPCHRVLKSDKSLGGFRWGIDAKKALLNSEGITDWHQ